MKSTLTIFAFLLTTLSVISQSIIVEGYVYESNNRGYINQAQIDILEDGSNAFITSTMTDIDGFFKVDLPVGRNFVVRAGKDLFVRKEVKLSAKDAKPEEKKFVNLELDRKPGYIFDVTIAEPRASKDATTMGIHGATVEVFNNTTEKETIRLPDYKDPNFKVTFEQGNHYTLLIRKEGFYAKKMEAYVNVKGCILCFDGVGSVQPGVSDNLTAGHQMGTLLANVELKPIVLDERTKLDNIKYTTGSATLSSAAKDDLRKLVDILKNNPGMKVELSSHTDSRGRADMNMKLSQKRAKVAMEYISSFSTGVNMDNIRSRGYGETRLVNGCRDGVTCSDREHQENRRTELQILEFKQEHKSEWKPLKEIKRLEKMELLLEELQNQEIVQIPVNSTKDLPEDLKKQIAQEKVDGTSKLEQKKDEKVDVIEEEAKFIKAAPKTRPSTKEVDKKPEAVAPPQKIVTPVANKVTAKPASIKPPKSKPKAVTKDDSVTEVAEHTYKELKGMVEGYNGFKIQVHESAYRLPASHELFQVFGNLTMDKTTGGFAYLLGDFKESKDANLFLKNIIQPRYPSAKLVKYEQGRRLVYQE